jgi:hypothetical protein
VENYLCRGKEGKQSNQLALESTSRRIPTGDSLEEDPYRISTTMLMITNPQPGWNAAASSARQS